MPSTSSGILSDGELPIVCRPQARACGDLSLSLMRWASFIASITTSQKEVTISHAISCLFMVWTRDGRKGSPPPIAGLLSRGHGSVSPNVPPYPPGGLHKSKIWASRSAESETGTVETTALRVGRFYRACWCPKGYTCWSCATSTGPCSLVPLFHCRLSFHHTGGHSTWSPW